jgi:hypothetical protein
MIRLRSARLMPIIQSSVKLFGPKGDLRCTALAADMDVRREVIVGVHEEAKPIDPVDGHH